MEVVYEDNHLLVVIKPPNILSQGDNTGDSSLVDMAKDYIKKKYNKPGNVYLGLVHRLDRPVGGLIVLAKTSKAAARLSADFKANRLDRKYVAVVKGRAKNEDNLTHYLLKDQKTNIVKAVKNGTDQAKEARLYYEKLKTIKSSANEELTLLEVTLFTGRSHQIRVQLSSSGLPIVGDMRYGDRQKGNIALFCHSISFTHPTKKEVMTFRKEPETAPFNLFY